MKKIKNFVYGIKKAYTARAGIELACFLASMEGIDNDDYIDIISYLKIASNTYKEASNLCPKWIVRLIVGGYFD